MAESFFFEFGLELFLLDLNKDEFWRFKELLKQEPPKLPLKPIPWPEVKKASKGGLAKLLEKHYPGKEAWEVTMKLFLKINRRDLWIKAQEEMRNKPRPYREHMKEKFQVIWEKETNLEVPEHFYRETTIREYTVLKEVFATSAGPVTVVLKGPEGIGKTTFLRKVMLEWAEETLWKKRFTFVFFFSIHEMNSMTETSLVELISRDWPESSALIAEMFSQPQKILFILDDFEHLKFDLDLKTNLCEDWGQQQPIDVILSSLLQKKMLPESSLLLSFGTLSNQKNCSLLQNPKYVTLLGFSESKRKSYFSLFFREKNRSSVTFNFVRAITQLFDWCQNPFVCWMVCTCMKWQLDRGKHLHIASQNTTSLYVSFLSNAFKAGGGNHPLQLNRARFQSLCALAAEGMWTQTFGFHLEDLMRNGVAEPDVSVWLSMQLLQRRGDGFSFRHVCIQEFCAAMFYFLRQPTSSPNPVIGSITQLITASMRQDQPRMVQVGIFLFGLSTEKVLRMLETSIGFLQAKDIKQEITQCLKSLSKYKPEDEVVNYQALFSSLFETQEGEFVREVMNLFEAIFVYVGVMEDLVTASFCLKHCQTLKRLHLCIDNICVEKSEPMSDQSEWLYYWQELCSVFSVSKDIQMLDLDGCTLDDVSMKILCKSLIHPVCKLQMLMCNFMPGLGERSDFFQSVLQNPHLKHLNLNGSSLTHSGVEQLCEMLKNPWSNIEELMLEHCDITVEACRHLSSVIMCSKHLEILSLVENPVMDAGVMVLCEALKHPDCALRTLMLSHCHLSYVSCDYLAQALLCNKSLTILDLGSNSLGDRGAEPLCAVLRRPDCSLQELWLTGCYLTPKACDDISTVLTHNEKLKTLKLGNNLFQDAGVKQLCEALRHPSCKLKRLGLNMCQLTAACCVDVASVLTSCKTLTHLDLSGISLDDDGADVLCQALSHQDCILQVLGLNKCVFSEKTQMLLKIVEEKNSHLTILPHLG